MIQNALRCRIRSLRRSAGDNTLHKRRIHNRLAASSRHVIPDHRSCSNAAVEHDNHSTKFSSYRTRTCGELRNANQHLNQYVRLCGWVHGIRELGSITFLSLRDRYGITQLVVDKDSTAAHAASNLRLESIVRVAGSVRQRPDKMKNSSMSTGDIEVIVESIEEVSHIDHGKSFPIRLEEPADNANDETRLRYRYLDLRRPQLQKNILLRSKITFEARKFLHDLDFAEIETPTLFKSTPEGAREFIVPTRTPGMFYALTQSPQQYKQLLMVGGMDRYFQIARCYRDENGRADRQPEFTQLDLEMSFVTQDDIMQLMELLVRHLWATAGQTLCSEPFHRISYAEAIRRFGIDKPDTRYGLELHDLTDLMRDSVLLETPCEKSSNGVVARGLNAKGLAASTPKGFSRKHMDAFMQVAHAYSIEKEAVKFALVKIEGERKEWKSYFTAKVSPEARAAINERLSVEEGDVLLVAIGTYASTSKLLGRMRIHAANVLRANGLLEEEMSANRYNMLWVTDFPLFSVEEGTLLCGQKKQSICSTHHPFTAPLEDEISVLADLSAKIQNRKDWRKDPNLLSSVLSLRAQHMDLVCNGWELGGGSIRLHSTVLQRAVFESILQLSPSQRESFAHLLEAFSYGAPPHGGIALGLDRLMTILCGAKSLREVIAFPKSATGKELMTCAPGLVENTQLREYHLSRINHKC